MQPIEVNFRSSNLKSIVKGYIYKPEGEIKAILQIAHGMCEYIKRYEEFIAYLLERGILVCGNDHIGHGGSIESYADRGYFSQKDGDICVVDDMYQLTRLVKKDYPNKKYFLLGHSMGSFASRIYASKHGKEIDGLILSGTGGKQPAIDIIIGLSKLMCIKEGERNSSLLIKKLAFGNYNDRFQPKRTSSDWLTRDTAIIDAYRKNDLSNFNFTNSGYITLFTLVKKANQRATFERTPQRLPIYLFSGDMDPVGAYGIGTTWVFHEYGRIPIINTEIKLYKEGRHEMLNEINRQEVYEDIYKWLENKI